MSEHPGIVFRPGPTGRRAALASGPDVREVAHAVKSARSTEPELADDRLPGLIADNTVTPLRLISTAVRYWASYPEKIDGQPGHHPTRLSSTEKDARIAADRRGKCDFDVPRRGCADLADLGPGLQPRGPAPANARPRRERLGPGPRLCGGTDS
jgi:hypothetical protein